MKKNDLVENYIELNNSFHQKLTYYLGAEAGFFSEINNMILAIIYCLDNKIKFTLYSKRGNFAHRDGWNDFFLSFCEQTNLFLHSRYNKRGYQMKKSKKFPPYFLKITTGNDFLTQDIWDSFRSNKFSQKLFTIPELNLEKASLLEASKMVISMIWRYHPFAKKLIEEYKNSLVLPDQYISIHIRSGDKNQETDTFSISKYMQKARNLNLSKNIFILTDDYLVIEKLRRNYHDWNFYTLCSPNENGYIHTSFQKKDSHKKYQQQLKLLASIEICTQSDHFIGTYSSNPGMFMGMRIGEENCSCIDYKSWVLW